MSDIEIIEAIRQSAPTLESTPAGVLSIVARYSRPNVFIFSTSNEMHVAMYHYTVKEPPRTITIFREGLLRGLCRVHNVIGVIGDDVYLNGVNERSEPILSSFNLSAHTLTFRGKTGNWGCMAILSPTCLYICGGRSKTSFRRRDLSTLEETPLPDMIVSKTFNGWYYYKDNLYIFGGFYAGEGRTNRCERFNIKENKWYNIAPMETWSPRLQAAVPRPAVDMRVTEKDGFLIIATMEGLIMYNPVRDEWSEVHEEAKLPSSSISLEAFQYNRGKFWAVSDANTYNPITVWGSASLEGPWESILRTSNFKNVAICTYLHLTDE